VGENKPEFAGLTTAERATRTSVGDERAFAILTLLVAVCEQAVLELETLEARPDSLLEQIDKTRSAAVEVGSLLGQRRKA
jgi:hypothetical protein